jgi:hypothetical protein
MTVEAPRLRVVAWNVRVGRRPEEVARQLALALSSIRADVVVLNEAAAYVPALRQALAHGEWKAWHAWGWAEARNVVVLTRRGLPVRRTVPIRNWRSWVGPLARRPHVGRTFLLVDVGLHWRIVAVHRTPGGPRGGHPRDSRGYGPNAEAWAEEHRRLVRLSARPGSVRRSLVIVGDQNCEALDPDPLSIGGLADAIGGAVVTTHTKVDHAVVRDATGRGRRHDYFGSDHPLVSYDLIRKEAA